MNYDAASIEISIGGIVWDHNSPRGSATITAGPHVYTATCTIPRRAWRRLRRALARRWHAPSLRLGPWRVRRRA